MLLSLLILTILTAVGFQNCSQNPLVLGTNSSSNNADTDPDPGLRYVLVNGNKSFTGSVGNNVVISWDFGDRQFNDLTVRIDKADNCAANLGLGAISKTGLKAIDQISFTLIGCQQSAKYAISVLASDAQGTLTIDSVNLEVNPYEIAGTYDFGGMMGGPSYYNNALTNPLVTACPPGYTSRQTLGAPNLDYDLHYCYRPHKAGRPADFDFGGMWGGSELGGYVNSVTGAKSCPAGYFAQQVRGAANIDYNLFYCWKPHIPGQKGIVDFGGIYAGTNTPYVNPLTNAYSCSTGFQSTQHYGSPALDYSLYMCTKLF